MNAPGMFVGLAAFGAAAAVIVVRTRRPVPDLATPQSSYAQATDGENEQATTA